MSLLIFKKGIVAVQSIVTFIKRLTRMYQNRSDAPGASGKSRSVLETSVVHRSTRDAPAVASPGLHALLEIQVQSSFCQTKGSSRDSSVDSGNGNAESALGS